MILSRKHQYILSLIFVLVMVLFPRLSTYSQVEQYQSKLKDLYKKIDEQRQLRNEVKSKELSILGQLQSSEQEIEKIKGNLGEIDQELKSVRGEIKRLNGEIATTQEKLAERQRLLGKRLSAIYKLGRHRSMRILSSAKDTADLIRRIRFLLIIAYQDQRLAKEIRQDKEHLESAKEVLTEHESEVTQLRQLTQSEEQRLKKEVAEQEKVYQKVHTERQSYEKVIAEMEAASRELEALIQQELAKASGSTELAPLTFSPPHKNYLSGNNVSSPTKGTIVRPYGKEIDPIYGTVTRNDGIDISAPQGQTVYSVMAGRVLYADWFKGYGKLVIVDHGSGYTTLYAHLQDIYVTVNDMLVEGQPVGTVGSSGTLGEVVLHFEIRKDGSAINPEKWLAGQY